MRIYLTFLALIGTIFVHSMAVAQNVSAGSEKQFTYGDGEQAFVLRQPFVIDLPYDATIQIEESREIWVLHKSQGARGTVVYRNDTGRVFLRVNSIGGATLYPTPDSMGVPVIRKSEYRFEANDAIIAEADDQLTSIEDWSRAYTYAGNKTKANSEKTGKYSGPKNIYFSDWPSSKSAYKTELISHLTGIMKDKNGRAVKRIIVKIGEKPAAIQNQTDLTIWVNPALGHAGRPSTEKILSHLMNSNG